MWAIPIETIIANDDFMIISPLCDLQLQPKNVTVQIYFDELFISKNYSIIFDKKSDYGTNCMTFGYKMQKSEKMQCLFQKNRPYQTVIATKKQPPISESYRRLLLYKSVWVLRCFHSKVHLYSFRNTFLHLFFLAFHKVNNLE